MSHRSGSHRSDSHQSGSSDSTSKDSSDLEKSSHSVQYLISALTSHRINTLTELCRVEQIAASCTSADDARAFQAPMTAAWTHYVLSHQLLSELRGMTRNYPFSGQVVQDSVARVQNDPMSNRSWNFAWLCLIKMRDDGLILTYASLEASKSDMWGSATPTASDVNQLTMRFEQEWMAAVETMLRHWTYPPTWY